MSALKQEIGSNVTPIVASELADLQNKINIMDWWHVSEIVSKACSLPEDQLLNPEASIPASSKAGRLQHQTMHQFITRTSSALGLAMDWNEWAETIQATMLKKRYSIHLTDKSQIVKQFNDIKNFIGREPISEEEYHVERDNFFTNVKNELQAKHRRNISELENKVQSLEFQSQTAESEISKLNELLDATKLAHKQELQELEKQKDTAIKANEMLAAEKLSEQKAALEAQHSIVIDEINNKLLLANHKHQEEVDRLQGQILSLQEEHKAEIERILSEYVSISKHREVELSLSKEREKSQAMLLEVQNLNDNNSKLEINNQSLSESLAQYEQKSISFKAQLEELQAKIVSGEISATDISAQKIQEIEAQNAELIAMKATYDAKVDELSKANEQKAKKIGSLTAKVKKYKKAIKMYRTMLIETQKSNTVFKLTTAAFLTSSVVLIILQGVKLLAYGG